MQGQYGTFSIDADGNWTYTADDAHNEFVKDQVYTDSFEVVSADGTETSVTVRYHRDLRRGRSAGTSRSTPMATGPIPRMPTTSSSTGYTDSFEVVSADGTENSVTVNITGTNDAAEVSAAVVT